MLILDADITKLWQDGHIVCVTTNGFTKQNGDGVMGKGNALAMARLIHDLPKKIGKHLKEKGNHVGFIDDRVIAFPVKPSIGKIENVLDRVKYMYVKKKFVPGYHCKANLNIIKRSVHELNQLAANINQNIYLPLPGVGNGNLTFKEVKPLLVQLNKNVVLVFKGKVSNISKKKSNFNMIKVNLHTKLVGGYNCV